MQGFQRDANGAKIAVGTGAVAFVFWIEAGERSQGTFGEAIDFLERNGGGGAVESIATDHAAFAFEDASIFENQEDLL